MSPEPQLADQALPVPILEELLLSPDFVSLATNAQQIEFVKSRLRTNSTTIIEISSLTIGQRDNPSWHQLRKGRLTASNFGCVLDAKRVTPSLIKRLLGEYDLSRVKAVAWGVTNEAEAIKEFTKQTKLQVVQTGLWLDESGILGASPDGLVDSNYVLEVKCPYTQRNESIEESLKQKGFCLEVTDNGITLKNTHAYWHQVQGQLYLAKREICFFVVWTIKWTKICQIHRDPSWEVNLGRLREFYFTSIFPKIVDGEL